MRKRLTFLNSFQKKQQLQQVFIPCELYRTCSQLPMDKFITCFVDKDLSVLIISGTPTEKELQQSWFNIQEEYGELIKNEELNHTNDIIKEIAVLQNKIFRISLCAEALQYVYCHDLVEELREQHIPFEFNPDMPEEYLNDIRKTVDRTRGLNLKLKLKQQELEDWYAQHASHKEEVSREQFDAVLATLTEFNGFLVDESKITVAMYARLFNHYRAKMIAQQRQMQKDSE